MRAAFRYLLFSVSLSLGVAGAAGADQPLRPNQAKLPDLYFVQIADLTDLRDSRPLSERMWVRVGNQGGVDVRNVTVLFDFWRVDTVGGKSVGKRYYTRTLTIPLLKVGQAVTLYPYSPSKIPGTPVSWAARIDPFNRVAESREDNNRTGRLWATLPAAATRSIPFDPAP
ncbi:MAG: hypothetical protein U0793_22085 [Gemmataceae bacterium]